MKNLILIFSLFALFSCKQQAMGQNTLPYKSFKEFANDTTAFLDYNFNMRAEQYKGKKVAQVLKDLQLKPKAYMPITSSYTGKYYGIYIYIESMYMPDWKTNYEAKGIYIYWPELMDYKNELELSKKYDNEEWVQQHYDFFKDMVVGEVKY